MPKEITMQYSEWKSLTDENEKLKKEIAEYESKSPAFAANEVKKEVETILENKLLEIIKKESNIMLDKEMEKQANMLHHSFRLTISDLNGIANINDVYKKIDEVHEFITNNQESMATEVQRVRWIRQQVITFKMTHDVGTRAYKRDAVDLLESIFAKLKANY